MSLARSWISTKAVSGGITLLVLIFLIAPILMLIPLSLTDQRFLSLPRETISFEHYVTLVTDPRWVKAIANSAILAVASALVSTVVGAMAAVALWTKGVHWALRLSVIVFAPLVVPAIIHALSFYWLWIQLDMIDTFVALLVTHSILGIPLVVVTVSAALTQVDMTLFRAAISMGATDFQAIRKIILPNVKMGIGAGYILSFSSSWDEVVATSFVAGRTWRTVPLQIWSGLKERVDPSIASLSVALVTVTVLIVVLARPWRNNVANGRV